MLRMPFVIAALVMATGFAWTVHLVVSPDPWAADSALAIAIGVLVLSIGAMAAMLLGRGRWTRYFAIGLVLAETLLILVVDFEGWMIAATLLGALALAGLGGPWLKGWLRERPAAGAPGIRPILLVIGAFAVVPLVGLATPNGLEPAHGLAGAAGILMSWGYAKGSMWALWGLRIALPLVLAAAALASPLAGSVVIIIAAASLAVIAWSGEARLAIDPLSSELPAPRPRRT